MDIFGVLTMFGGLALFLYSLFFLFYVGDYLDNHRRPSLKELPYLVAAVLINTVVTGPGRVVLQTMPLTGFAALIAPS